MVPDGAFTHPAPPTEASSFDICNGQQGTDLAVPDTCELEIQIEGAASLEEG